MPEVSFSVLRKDIAPQDRWSLPHGGPALGLAHVGGFDIGTDRITQGTGGYIAPGTTMTNPGDSPATMIAFILSSAPLEDAASQEIVDISFPCLWRLDEVSFPPGAIAYRHVHAGPGFRHLRRGALHLQADDHAFDALPGTTWFEAENSPVRATASAEAPKTRFVRSMILPVALKDKPSITILDPADAARPKRQTTHRHVDRILRHWPQVDAG